MSRPIILPLFAIAIALNTAAAAPDSVVVFNELQYNPPGATEDGEWIELFNQMGIKVDVSGWQIDGLDYTFPDGTIIDAESYVVVAKTPTAGQLGPFTGSLSNSGENLQLFNQSGRLMDELDYGDDGRWPAAADGSGITLAKRAPFTANSPPENWAPSTQIGGTPGAINFPSDDSPPQVNTVPLLALADEWRYNESGSDLGSSWATVFHPVGGDWELGAGGIGFESGGTIPIATTLSFPALNNPYVVTYYFEREFQLSAAQLTNLNALVVRHGFDDGAIVYLNGVEVLRVNMPNGAITASTLSSSGTEVDELSAGIPILSSAAVAGSNRISVEVHQESLGSSDVVFGLELDAQITSNGLGAAPDIAFNEVPAADEASFWIELINRGTSPFNLDGMIVSAAADPARRFVLNTGTLAPDALLVIDEATLGFRPLDGEKLFLFDAAEMLVIDARQTTGRLRGLHDGAWLYPSAATPGTPNSFVFNNDIVISEIAYNPPGLPSIAPIPPTFANSQLVAMGDTWRFNRADENLPSNWASTSHPVAGNWEQAPGPIGRETGSLPIPLATAWSAGEFSPAIVTYYFETDFNLSAADLPQITGLELTHQIDDGAVFYLNGVELARFNIPSGAVNSETLANPSVGNAAPIAIQVPFDALIAGTNRLSVEVHQSTTGSSDLVFGAQLDSLIQTSAGSPGLPFRNSSNQWLEIANRGSSSVDLSEWKFSDGISFTFPLGTTLAAGEYACVVADPIAFGAAFPSARMLGTYSGSLSRSGERLELIDANENPVDLVRFYDGGRWPSPPDGGGSTLELRDLDADNNVGTSWAPSDESIQTAWKTYTYSKTAASSRGPDNQWIEFNMGLLGAGEILIDDITVTGGGQRITDPGFNSPNAWRLRGNHRHSEIIDDPDQPGNKVLRIVATGPSEHMHNQIETTLSSSISNGSTYEISFRARWVSGSNQIHTRLYFNRCANLNIIDRPANPGTPSAPNSTAVANIGPAFSSMLHSPAVPDANQPTKVSIKASDPDGISNLTLFYSVNGGAFQTTPMGPTGGRFEGTIPGQGASAVVQFYVSGTDSQAATSLFPPNGSDSRALYKVNDGLAATNGLHNFRVVMTAADVAFQHTVTEVMSNDRLEATVIDREGEVYYGCGVRLKSSERGRSNLNRVGYNISFPADSLYHGAHDTMAIDRSEGQSPGQFELLFDMMISNSGGILSRYYDLVKVLAPNGALTGSATLQMARYDNLFLDSQFENGSDGNLYEYELIYYPTTASNGLKLPQPDNVIGVNVSDAGDDPELYRFFFLNKINREADNFTPIIAYNKKISQSGAAFEEGLEDVIDVDSWLRGMAYAVLSGAGDNAAAGSQHNGVYYAKTDGRIVFFPHDMDFSFDASRSIFANPECSKLTQNPVRRRIYFGHLHDIISTTYNNSYMSMWTTHFASLDPAQNWSTELNFMTSRSNNVLNQINSSIPPIAFNITTASPLTVAGATATVVGDGWVDVREIRLQGTTAALPVVWTDNNSWQINVPAPPGINTVTIEAINFSGDVIATDTITINNTTPFEPASAGNLVISEIMYHPSNLTTAEITAGITDPDQFEFIELQNISSVLVDLTGVRFIGGITYDFANATVLNPGQRLVVVRDRSAFLLRHAAAGAVIASGQFTNATGLSNAGENLQLQSASGTDIRNFTYDDQLPWPTAADGDGFSLILIDPMSNPDHALASNWRSSTTTGGNPGSSDATSFVGDPNTDADSDGLDALLEYAFGSSDNASDPSPLNVSLDTATGLLQLSYPRNLSADDVTFSIETSSDLDAWSDVANTFVIVSETPNNGDGTSTIVWRATSQAGSRRFIRLVATAN